MPRKEFIPQPDDTYARWIWGNGNCLTLNLRYYLTAMPKTKRDKLDNQMTALRATMTTLNSKNGGNEK